jgi:hypothetical protein
VFGQGYKWAVEWFGRLAGDIRRNTIVRNSDCWSYRGLVALFLYKVIKEWVYAIGDCWKLKKGQEDADG